MRWGDVRRALAEAIWCLGWASAELDVPEISKATELVEDALTMNSKQKVIRRLEKALRLLEKAYEKVEDSIPTKDIYKTVEESLNMLYVAKERVEEALEKLSK